MKFSDILRQTGASEPAAVDAPMDRPWRRAAALYGRLVSAARILYRAARDGSEPGGLPDETLRDMAAELAAERQELLVLANRSTPDNFLYGHAANLAVLSMHMGVHLGLSEGDIRVLALSGFLNDIGMMRHLPLALKPGKLTDEEMKALRRHPEDSRELLSLFPGLPEEVRAAVSRIIGQTHERAEGTGYPAGLASGAVHRFAKIVAVCDVYEALCHPRPWRPGFAPHLALRRMIEDHEGTFESGLVKVLIEALSLYPPGSFVRLNSGETGRVVAVNPGLPTRPRVVILAEALGRRLEEPRTVNLAAQPALYVADALDESILPTPDRRLLLSLRAQRWCLAGL